MNTQMIGEAGASLLGTVDPQVAWAKWLAGCGVLDLLEGAVSSEFPVKTYLPRSQPGRRRPLPPAWLRAEPALLHGGEAWRGGLVVGLAFPEQAGEGGDLALAARLVDDDAGQVRIECQGLLFRADDRLALRRMGVRTKGLEVVCRRLPDALTCLLARLGGLLAVDPLNPPTQPGYIVRSRGEQPLSPGQRARLVDLLRQVGAGLGSELAEEGA
ncbi:MAG: hypothetical protein ABIO70_34745 [Pseudomonadota bacterium]